MGTSSYLSVGQAAYRLRVSVETIRNMMRDGRLSGIRSAGGWRLIRDGDVEALAAKRRNMPPAAETTGAAGQEVGR